MGKNYFSIERNGECWDRVSFVDTLGNTVFDDFVKMTYDEMKSSDKLTNFIVSAMDAANQADGGEDALTVVTLVGEDGIFIWSIIMGPGENGDIRYSVVDWKSDNKNYRYES